MSHHHHGYHHGSDRCGCECAPRPHFHHHARGCCDDGSQQSYPAHGCCGGSEQGSHHGQECCGGSFSLKRRYWSPEEKKEKLASYIDALKKELAGAEAALEKL